MHGRNGGRIAQCWRVGAALLRHGYPIVDVRGRIGPVQVLLDVRVTVAVWVETTVVRVDRVQAVSLFPGVRHAVPVAIDERGAWGQLRPAAYFSSRTDDFACPRADVLD